MTDESNILYVGQRIKTITILGIHKSTDRKKEVSSMDVSHPDNYFGYSVTYKCDCDTVGAWPRMPTTIEQFLNGRKGSGREGIYCSRCHSFAESHNRVVEYIDTGAMNLYYIRYNTNPPLYKIGVSSGSIRKRFGANDDGLITELISTKYPSRSEAFAAELEIKHKYKAFLYTGGVDGAPSTGLTETFIMDVLGVDKSPQERRKGPRVKLERFDPSAVLKWVGSNVTNIIKSEGGYRVIATSGECSDTEFGKAVRRLMNGIVDQPRQMLPAEGIEKTLEFARGYKKP